MWEVYIVISTINRISKYDTYEEIPSLTLKKYYFMCICVCPKVYACTLCAFRSLWGVRKTISFPGAGVTKGYEQWCGCWELTQVLSTRTVKTLNCWGIFLACPALILSSIFYILFPDRTFLNVKPCCFTKVQVRADYTIPQFQIVQKV